MGLFPLQGQVFGRFGVVDNAGLVRKHLPQRGEIDHGTVNVHLERRSARILLHLEAQEAIQKPAKRALCGPWGNLTMLQRETLMFFGRT